MKSRYLIYLAMCLVPELSGCLLQDFALKSDVEIEVDAEPMGEANTEE
jgi:hypothetical protein